MSDFRSRVINAVAHRRSLPNSSLDFPDPATLPTHCFIVDRTRVNGHPINEIVPVMQDPPAPDILDPALQCGLYNPDACVRRGVVEAMGKTYGANAMKKAKREQEEAKARLKRLAEANVPFTLGILTDEELAAFDELINDDELREGTTAAEEKGGGGESARLQKEGEKPAVGAAAPEDMGEESTTEEEEEGKEAIIRTAAVEKAGEEKDKQKPAARAATESAKNKANLAKPKARTKQAKPAPLGTAWFLQRGKELERRSGD